MYPHERSLVEKYQESSFHHHRRQLRSRSREAEDAHGKEENITWRSFYRREHRWCNSHQRWNVSGWPTIYVIDANGIIRAKNARGAKLEEWIEKLVKEAEAEGPKQ